MCFTRAGSFIRMITSHWCVIKRPTQFVCLIGLHGDIVYGSAMLFRQRRCFFLGCKISDYIYNINRLPEKD